MCFLIYVPIIQNSAQNHLHRWYAKSESHTLQINLCGSGENNSKGIWGTHNFFIFHFNQK